MKFTDIEIRVMSSGDYWLGRYHELQNMDAVMSELFEFLQCIPSKNWNQFTTIFGK